MKNIINPHAQFFYDLQNEKDIININGNDTPRAYWNLILSIRDCKLYSKGIKPHRNWKISDVKEYFGIKGNAESMYKQLIDLKTFIDL